MAELVVLTGYPAAGKTTLANHLVERHGYVHASGDALRQALLHRDFLQNAQYTRREDFVARMVGETCRQALKQGLSVVADTTAAHEEYREFLLGQAGFFSKPSLVWVRAPREELDRRIRQRGHDPEVTFSSWDHYWTDPVRSRKYALVTYDNASPEDLERMLADAGARFGRR